MRRAVPVDRLIHPQDEHGLGVAEAAQRRERYGPNDIIEVARSPWWDLLRDTVKDPMIWFLAGTATLYAVLGQPTEAATLLVALVPLVGMDAFLHRRTQASTEGLASRLATTATVMREGRAIAIAAGDVVPGDLAIVSAGEPFPADGIVAGGSEMQADESALTGEAYPVRKRPLDVFPVGPSEPIVEDLHWGFAGTRLLTGRALLRVVFTGGETLYGEIVRSARSGAHARTPLQKAVSGLVSVLVVAATALCLVLAFIRYRQGHGLVDAALSAVTLGVAALPEEFPVAFTFFLGVGVFRLARRQALVRRAVSVENIGRVTCICADKTGTMTEGRLRVSGYVAADGVTRARVLELASMASRRETGDPLDAAILDDAAGHGITTPAEVVATFPFTEDRRRETAIVRQGALLLVATKGSPEVILDLAGIDTAERARWDQRVSGLAQGGHKVIACAWRSLEEGQWPGGEPSRGYTFAGLLVCEDSIREGVAEAVGRCRQAGIHTIMVTGDHPATAVSVAHEIGLGVGEPRVVLGEDLDRELRAGRDFRGVDVIARAIPAQKLDLVRALQARGEIVAVTGDGVNDVPALQAADVGIAMGGRGTRSAREVASIVLLDDNFRSIVRAIAEGRQLFRNLQLSYQYLLIVHVCLVITATLIPLAGYPLLYLPIHIVWLETLIHPTAMLVFQELPSADGLGRPDARRDAGFFTRSEWVVILGVGLLLTAVVTFGYARSLAGGHVEHARAMAMATLTFASAALAATLSGLRTRVSRVVSAATVTISLVVIQTPAIAARVHIDPLHLDDWVIATGAALAAVGVLLAARLIQRRRPPRIGPRPLLRAAVSAGVLVLLGLSVTSVSANPPTPDVDRLLARLDDLYRSKSSIARIEIQVVRPRATRTLRLQAWTRGEDEALVLIEAPPREAGTATLRVRDNLWNYLPRIARTIRVPPSMMLGSWMGTDFTNDDLVKESSLRKDFVGRVDRRSDDPAGWWLTLEAKPGAVGRWARIEVLVSDEELPIEERHFDRKGRLARTMRFDEVKILSGRRLPSHIVLVPADTESESTAMRYLEARFDVPLADDTFSLSRLEHARAQP